MIFPLSRGQVLPEGDKGPKDKTQNKTHTMIVKLTYQKVSKNGDIEVKTSERNLLSVNPESARQLALELVNSWNLQTNGDVFALRDAVEVTE